MRILFVTSEVYPLIKTGGLADVSSALPAALCGLGQDVRILIPGYRQVFEKIPNLSVITQIDDLPLIGNATLMAGQMPGTNTPVIVIANPVLYERDGSPYLDAKGKDWDDNALRFGILSNVAARLCNADSPLQDWIPDIVHCNDWQSGLTPAYMKLLGNTKTKSILSIHNLAFQGNYGKEWVRLLNLPEQAFKIDGLEYYGQLSFLKAGVFYSDILATVSPTYANEIQTPEYGFGMQGLLSQRHMDIVGILNGIDTDEWNPASDLYLPHMYSASTLLQKTANKLALQKQLGLYEDANAPLLGVVSRITHQKGLDLFANCANTLLRQGCQITLLGGGDPLIEDQFNVLGQNYPGQVSVTIGYNEPLSHKIMSGSDIFIMPSRFEPCGLNQMYGLRYGTPPVVRRTGGLADSVKNVDETSLADGTATGFVFDHADEKELLTCVQRAVEFYRKTDLWKQIQLNGMKLDLGWGKSAKAYIETYQQLLTKTD